MRPTLCLMLLLVLSAPRAAAEDVTILARNLSARSNSVAPEYAQFGNLTLCVGAGGFMEWTAQLRGGTYYVHFFYASGQPRPCRMSVNGRPLPGEVLGDATGGFMPQDLRWQTCGPAGEAQSGGPAGVHFAPCPTVPGRLSARQGVPRPTRCDREAAAQGSGEAASGRRDPATGR